MFFHNQIYFLLITLCLGNVLALPEHTRNNGDIYTLNDDKVYDDFNDVSSTTMQPMNPDNIDFGQVMKMCNASFITPISNVLQLNTTGSLPDEYDQTSMCFIRCFFEKSGFLKNWKLNRDLVRKYIWPATGDSLEVCENTAMNESNACVRGYAIVKCIVTRELVDARNNPMV